MGMKDILYGYIREATPGRAGGPEKILLKEQLAKEIKEHNKSMIENLPIDDEWPFLSRPMFYHVPSGHLLDYKNPVIIFGGSFKDICYEWHEWLPKFENLIGQLYWESIVITLDSETVGERKFSWSTKSEWFKKMCDGQLEKITEWDFEGERQFFDGINQIA